MARLRATYRLQLTPDFGFGAARQVVPYLVALGVSHLYLSPSLQARPGSQHGYDVIDPTRISEDLGGEAEFRKLCTAGLGVVLDIVPNHMAVDDGNRWWTDPYTRDQMFDVDDRTGWYRRFFDVDELVGVRQRDPRVFEVTHGTVLRLVHEGLIDGLRVDHPDGLADPAEYLRRLRGAGVEQVWVEKIVHPGERLRDWPVSGSTGYDYLADASALFVDPAGEAPLTDLYETIAGEKRPFAELAREGKLLQATTTFAPEIERLQQLAEVPGIVDALVDLPIYRTYVEPSTGLVADEDRAAIEAAGIHPDLARILLLEERGHDEFVTRFQQTSPPVMAKGVEDTAFYRYHRLIALNEVGNDPGRFSLSVDAFHASNLDRLQRFPDSLLAATTHDTKRSADCRFRIGALAGLAESFAEHLALWMAATGSLVDGGAPSPAEQWFVYQTLLGAWPIGADRLSLYLKKALREAKVNTSWVDPDLDYERRVQDFAHGLLEHPAFLADFRPFADEVAAAGERASAAEALLRCTVPGIPDIFQGDELWFLGLVDPDNRRPLDWTSRRRALKRVEAGAAPTRATAKLHVLQRALDVRRRRPGPFESEYQAIDVGEHTVAFLRGAEEVLVVASLRPDPSATIEAPPGRWTEVLSGTDTELFGPQRVSDLTGDAGLALLVRPPTQRATARARR